MTELTDVNVNLDVNVAAPSVEPGTEQQRKQAWRFTWMDLWLFILMIIWGSNIAILKTALEVLPPYVLNGLRFSAAMIVLALIFKANGIRLTLPRREWTIVIVIALIGQVLYQGVFLYALHLTTVANSALISAVMPVWIVLYNAWRGHERMSRGGILGILLAMFGVSLVILSRDKLSFGLDTLPGDLLTIVATLLWAAMMLLSRGPLKRNSAVVVAFWIVAWGALFQLLLGVPDLLRLDRSILQPGLLLTVLYSGVVSIGIGNTIWNRAISVMGTGRPAAYTYLEPIIAGLTAAIFLGEPLTVALVIGGVLVLLGVVLVREG